MINDRTVHVGHFSDLSWQYIFKTKAMVAFNLWKCIIKLDTNK